jgi:hypothetical protein
VRREPRADVADGLIDLTPILEEQKDDTAQTVGRLRIAAYWEAPASGANIMDRRNSGGFAHPFGESPELPFELCGRSELREGLRSPADYRNMLVPTKVRAMTIDLVPARGALGRVDVGG